MPTLGIDIGSSSVKAAILNGDRIVGQHAYVPFATQRLADWAEVRPATVLSVIAKAIAALGPAAKSVDWINFATMSPAWVAMDADGRALTPIVTHQDRRSLEQAHELRRRVGAEQFLSIAGNEPFPGGISATTWLWFKQNHPDLLAGVDLVGHLTTFLIRQLTGRRAIDPSNASFTGLYETTRLGGWSQSLCDAAEVPRSVLPDLLDADQIAGVVTPAGARRFHLRAGTPVLCGLVDTSAAFFLTELAPGQLLNVCGSTDVLAMLTDKPEPRPDLLTRGLGVGRRWLAVSTLAASGSSIAWVQSRFFSEMPDADFVAKVRKLAEGKVLPPTSVTFQPYLAGDRMSLEQRQGELGNLTLATTRDDILFAVAKTLAAASARRLGTLSRLGIPFGQKILVSGGERESMDTLLRLDWPKHWRYRPEPDATVRGLGRIQPRG